MEEADELCDRVAIIDLGKILVQDTPAALKASVGVQKIYQLDLREREQTEKLIGDLTGLAGVASAEKTAGGVRGDGSRSRWPAVGGRAGSESIMGCGIFRLRRLRSRRFSFG